MTMNILQTEDLIKGLPDERLMQEAQQPSGQLPQFLLVSEVQRRMDMRKRYATENQEQPQGTVAEQIMGEAQQGIAAMQQPQQGPPQQMYGGGIVRMQGGGYTPSTMAYPGGMELLRGSYPSDQAAYEAYMMGNNPDLGPGGGVAPDTIQFDAHGNLIPANLPMPTEPPSPGASPEAGYMWGGTGGGGEPVIPADLPKPPSGPSYMEQVALKKAAEAGLPTPEKPVTQGQEVADTGGGIIDYLKRVPGAVSNALTGDGKREWINPEFAELMQSSPASLLAGRGRGDVTVQGQSPIQTQAVDTGGTEMGSPPPSGGITDLIAPEPPPPIVEEAGKGESNFLSLLAEQANAKSAAPPDLSDLIAQQRKDSYSNALVQLGASIAAGDLSGGLSKAGNVMSLGNKGARDLETQQRMLQYGADKADVDRKVAVYGKAAVIEASLVRSLSDTSTERGRKDRAALDFIWDYAMSETAMMFDVDQKARRMKEIITQSIPPDLAKRTNIDMLVSGMANIPSQGGEKPDPSSFFE
jgi:hypothetical protein